MSATSLLAPLPTVQSAQTPELSNIWAELEPPDELGYWITLDSVCVSAFIGFVRVAPHSRELVRDRGALEQRCSFVYCPRQNSPWPRSTSLPGSDNTDGSVHDLHSAPLSTTHHSHTLIIPGSCFSLGGRGKHIPVRYNCFHCSTATHFILARLATFTGRIDKMAASSTFRRILSRNAGVLLSKHGYFDKTTCASVYFASSSLCKVGQQLI